MTPTEHPANTASTPKPGRLATLRGLLPSKGAGAPARLGIFQWMHEGEYAGLRQPLFAALATFAVTLIVLAFAAAAALAAGPPEEPTTISPAASITGTSAIFEGTLNPHSKATVGGFFAYSNPEGLTCLEGPTVGLEGFEGEKEVQAQPVHAKVALEARRTYKFCLVATNEGGMGVTPGKEVTVTTPAVKPTIVREFTSQPEHPDEEVRLEAAVNPNNETTECHFQYGETSVSENEKECEQGNALEGGEQGVSLLVPGLKQGTTYHYRVIVKNATGEEKGKPEPVTTSIHPETPEKLEANPIAASTATLNGVLNPAAVGDAGSYEFFYQQSETECQGEHQQTASGAATGAKGELAEAKVTELLPHKPYTFCLLAKNEAGEESTLSETKTFITLAAAPRIEEQSASDIASTSATLNATVNPQGAETTYTFEYAPVGGTFAPVIEPEGKGSGTLPEGVTGVPLSVHVQKGLVAGAAYEFRVVVGNSVQQGVSVEPVSFTTQSASTAFALPDNRQWEMVSPPLKEGARIAWNQAAGLTAAAAAGGAITYASEIPTEAEPVGFDNKAQELSTRGPDGWQTHDLQVPHVVATGPSISRGVEYRFFSSDLSQAIVQPFGTFTPCVSAVGTAQPCLSPAASEPTAYLNDLGTGAFAPLVTGCPAVGEACPPTVAEHADVPPGTIFGAHADNENAQACAVEQQYCGPFFIAATPDLSHVVLESRTALTSGGSGGLYEWSAGRPPSEQLQLLGVLPKGGAYVGGVGTPEDGGVGISPVEHSLSDDGSVFFDYGGHLYLQDVAKHESFLLDVAQPGVTPPAQDEATFLYASSDGSKVLFSDPQQLTGAPGGGVYECRIAEGADGPACASLQLTGISGEGVLLGGSEDASYLYFLGAEEKLYVDHYDGTRWTQTLVTQLSGDDEKDWTGTLSERPLRVSPNGEWLAFMAQESLTGYDNRDAVSGKPDAQVYLYHADANGGAGTLTCASCEPTGARPVGVEYEETAGEVGLTKSLKAWPKAALVAANVPAWDGTFPEANVPENYQARYLSDSGRLFFNSDDALVPQDVNGTEDVYEYEPVKEGNCEAGTSSGSEVYVPQEHGCVGLISSGSSSEESALLDATESGNEVFFLTSAKLAPQDVDTALDVYDARICEPENGNPCLSATVAPPPCNTEASCKPAPTPQPSIYGVGPSETFTGPGNLAPPPPAVVKKVTKKIVKCKRGLVKNKKSRCVKKSKKKKSKATKSAHTNRRTHS